MPLPKVAICAFTQVLQSAPYAHPSDLWSLGVIIYELLVLKRPFDGEHLASIAARISSADFDEGALLRCGHPKWLTRLVSRDALFRIDPEERMQVDEVISIIQQKC